MKAYQDEINATTNECLDTGHGVDLEPQGFGTGHGDRVFMHPPPGRTEADRLGDAVCERQTLALLTTVSGADSSFCRMNLRGMKLESARGNHAEIIKHYL